VGIGQPEFDARAFVGHAPVEHEQEGVAFEDFVLVRLEQRPARPICAHPIIAGLVSLDPVALRQEHPVVGTLE
jgi:hypothetical protein